jgi:tetratricopeptide (TPR) repeat protein
MPNPVHVKDNVMTDLLQKLRQAEDAEAHFDAIDLLKKLVEENPEESDFRYKLGLKYIRTGDPEKGVTLLQECSESGMDNPMLDVNLGHALKALGRFDEAADAYKRVITGFDDERAAIAYWSLANLKNYRFSDQETVILQGRAQIAESSPGYGALMLFALASARENQGNYEEAFMAMSEANLVMAAHRPFNAEEYYKLVQSMVKEIQAPAEPFEQDGPTPIFIVGMPRSGTTLVEQVLANHSLVEATDELPFLSRFGLGLEQTGGYAWALARFTPEQKKNFAANYMKSVSPYISGEADYFIDKNPANFINIGLIKAIFPQAKIINVVRDTLDNAMGVYKQYFHQGNEFSYSMQGIIYYWQGYITLMQHWDRLYPGDILHLGYESMVRAPNEKIAAILDYCGLPHEEACLRFYESDRPVLTPSAAQVRSPITDKSVGSGLIYQDHIQAHIPALAEITRKAREVLSL